MSRDRNGSVVGMWRWRKKLTGFIEKGRSDSPDRCGACLFEDMIRGTGPMTDWHCRKGTVCEHVLGDCRVRGFGAVYRMICVTGHHRHFSIAGG